MPTLVNGSLPANQLALAETFAAHPDLAVRIGKVVTSGDDTVMPLLWAQNVPTDELIETLEADPTVDEVELVADQSDEDLYRMEWTDNIQFILQMITNSEATILDAIGRSDGWRLRVLYPDRESFAETKRFCETHGIDFDVTSIRGVDRSSASRYGLTSEQRDSIVEATRQGYFAIPREITLEELAEEVDLSHQALSERIRRATEALVENTLLYEPGEAGELERSA